MLAKAVTCTETVTWEIRPGGFVPGQRVFRAAAMRGSTAARRMPKANAPPDNPTVFVVAA